MPELSPLAVATIWSFALELGAIVVVYPTHSRIGGEKATHVFFSPQDYVTSEMAKKLKVKFPKESETAKFEPFVPQYFGMVKVIIGLAAASISFGGLNTHCIYIYTAKLLLAYSIFFALLFSVTMVNFYENYREVGPSLFAQSWCFPLTFCTATF